MANACSVTMPWDDDHPQDDVNTLCGTPYGYATAHTGIIKGPFIYYRPQSEGDTYVLGSVRLSARPSVPPLSYTIQTPIHGAESWGCVCVSVISGRMRIIAQMRSIGF